MKMMGKRVNYAARSVISADPNLETNEVGVPLFIAKKLTYPEPVNEYNVAKLRELVIRGPNYPGANYLVENGRKI
jgi:DNA-directed RNA polymerase I subunit RPA1